MICTLSLCPELSHTSRSAASLFVCSAAVACSAQGSHPELCPSAQVPRAQTSLSNSHPVDTNNNANRTRRGGENWNCPLDMLPLELNILRRSALNNYLLVHHLAGFWLLNNSSNTKLEITAPQQHCDGSSLLLLNQKGALLQAGKPAFPLRGKGVKKISTTLVCVMDCPLVHLHALTVQLSDDSIPSWGAANNDLHQRQPVSEPV